LAVSPNSLLPIETGLELRIYNLLKPLCSVHQISLICFAPPKGVSKEISRSLNALFSRVEFVALDYAKGKTGHWFNTVHKWFSPSEVSLGNVYDSNNMKEAIQSILQRDDYDLVFVASPYMANYLLNVTCVPVVFDTIDDPSLLYYREIRQKRNVIGKVRAIKDWLVTRQVEKKFYGRFEEIVISSPVDARITSSLCTKSNITVIPNGVDSQYFSPHYSGPSEPILIFTGVMGYPPNIMAMIYFCKSIFPLITREIPEAKLLIVGRYPSREILRLEETITGVKVTGKVEDVRPYMSQSKIYVCPLISGAGIKNKILEAWASGKPIVATSLSCQGIEVSPGENVLIADDARSFADTVVNLLQDENLASKLAIKGREKVLKYYNWESKAKVLEEVFQRAVCNFAL